MEGPGIYLIKESLQFLMNKTILKVSGNTKENKEILIGKKVVDIKSHGKRLIFEFEKIYLIIHFLMYGSLRINDKRDRKSERLSLKFDDNEINFYNTSIKIVEKNKFSFSDDNDIMSRNFNKEKAKEKIKNSNRLITDLLLDQEIFAGVGNIIKNEALFRAKIHPLSIGNKIYDKAIEKLIEELISFSYEFYLSRKFKEPIKNKLKIYGKKFCSNSSEKVKIKYLGETKRKTYFCESCQILYM